MNTVSREEMEEAWDELATLDETQTKILVNEFMEEQPALGIYLFAGAESMEEEQAEESPVIDLALAAWRAMSQTAGQQLQMVEPDTIERAEEANTEALENLAEGSEMDWNQYTRQLVGSYNQRELLGFGIEVLMSGNEETPELAPDAIGLELLEFKTVLDCLDQ